MSVDNSITCDHCGAARSVSLENPPRWATISVENLRARTQNLHVCPACVPDLAAYFGKVPRDAFEPYAEHETTVHFAAKMPCLPGKSVKLMITMDKLLFWTRRLEIDRAAEWMVQDVVVGNRPQFSSDVPAEALCGGEVSFDGVSRGMDYAITASYIGANPEGGLLSCKAHGTALGFAPA